MSSKARKVESGEAASQGGVDIAELLAEHEHAFEEINKEFEALGKKEAEEVVKVHHKYALARRPVFEKRTELMKKIPKIWFYALCHNPVIEDLFNAQDQAVLQYLQNLDVVEGQEVGSFRLDMVFGKNPFFKNSTLSFQYHVQGDDDTVECTPIEWHEGKNFTKSSKGKKRENDEMGFFAAFQNAESFAQVAQVIKENIWPDPFGTQSDDDDDDGDDGDGELGEEDDGEGEDGDEGDDDEGAED